MSKKSSAVKKTGVEKAEVADDSDSCAESESSSSSSLSSSRLTPDPDASSDLDQKPTNHSNDHNGLAVSGKTSLAGEVTPATSSSLTSAAAADAVVPDASNASLLISEVDYDPPGLKTSPGSDNPVDLVESSRGGAEETDLINWDEIERVEPVVQTKNYACGGRGRPEWLEREKEEEEEKLKDGGTTESKAVEGRDLQEAADARRGEDLDADGMEDLIQKILEKYGEPATAAAAGAGTDVVAPQTKVEEMKTEEKHENNAREGEKKEKWPFDDDDLEQLSLCESKDKNRIWESDRGRADCTAEGLETGSGMDSKRRRRAESGEGVASERRRASERRVESERGVATGSGSRIVISRRDPYSDSSDVSRVIQSQVGVAKQLVAVSGGLDELNDDLEEMKQEIKRIQSKSYSTCQKREEENLKELIDYAVYGIKPPHSYKQKEEEGESKDSYKNKEEENVRESTTDYGAKSYSLKTKKEESLRDSTNYGSKPYFFKPKEEVSLRESLRDYGLKPYSYKNTEEDSLRESTNYLAKRYSYSQKEEDRSRESSDYGIRPYFYKHKEESSSLKEPRDFDITGKPYSYGQQQQIGGEEGFKMSRELGRTNDYLSSKSREGVASRRTTSPDYGLQKLDVVSSYDDGGAGEGLSSRRYLSGRKNEWIEEREAILRVEDGNVNIVEGRNKEDVFRPGSFSEGGSARKTTTQTGNYYANDAKDLTLMTHLFTVAAEPMPSWRSSAANAVDHERRAAYDECEERNSRWKREAAAVPSETDKAAIRSIVRPLHYHHHYPSSKEQTGYCYMCEEFGDGDRPRKHVVFQDRPTTRPFKNYEESQSIDKFSNYDHPLLQRDQTFRVQTPYGQSPIYRDLATAGGQISFDGSYSRGQGQGQGQLSYDFILRVPKENVVRSSYTSSGTEDVGQSNASDVNSRRNRSSLTTIPIIPTIPTITPTPRRLYRSPSEPRLVTSAEDTRSSEYRADRDAPSSSSYLSGGDYRPWQSLQPRHRRSISSSSGFHSRFLDKVRRRNSVAGRFDNTSSSSLSSSSSSSSSSMKTHFVKI